MTNTSTYSLILLVLLLFGACKKDDQSIDLTLKLSYGDTPLVMLDEYVFPSGELIKFTRFSFFISDVAASIDGKSSELVEVDFIDLSSSHSSLDNSAVGYTYTLKDIQDGTIESIDLTLGVNSILNKNVPSDFEGQHPLAKPGEYWIAWDSFIFLKIEGIADLDGDGETETNVALHVGSDQVARQVSIPGSDADSYDVNIDLMSIFKTENTTFDIQNNPQIHSLSQIEHANFLMDNFSKAF